MTQDQQQKKADGRDPNREHMTLSELWQLWRDNLMSWRSFCDEHHDLFTLNIQAGFRRIGRWLSDLHSNARALAAANRDRRFPESEYGAAQLFLFFRGSLERRAAAIREGFSNRRKALTWMGGKRRHFFEKMHLHPVAFLCGAMAIAAAATVLSLYTLGAQVTYDGQDLGIVSSRRAAEKVVAELEDVTRATTGDGGYTVDTALLTAETGVFPRRELISDDEFEELSLSDEYIASLSKIFIIACGSSYHVGVVGKYNLERLMRKPVEVCLASEFRYSDPLVDDKTLVIVISQSGETLDTMAALREAKARGAHILSIVNVVGSSIARESDDVLYTWAGPEIAVATTKAYSTQLVLLDMLGLYFADALGTVSAAQYDEIIEELLRLPGKMEQMLEDIEDIKHFASNYFNHNSVFFIGRNLDYAMGLEGSLKLKEISYIHSEAYASGELKHGTISLIEDGTLVIALGTYEPLFDKAMSNIVEVQARGADVLALTTESNVAEMKKTVENVISVPETHTILQPSLGVVPLQLFAYYVALLRGCDIDKPRNLAKSVTVE